MIEQLRDGRWYWQRNGLIVQIFDDCRQPMHERYTNKSGTTKWDYRGETLPPNSDKDLVDEVHLEHFPTIKIEGF